jgi:exonuclease SbcD
MRILHTGDWHVGKLLRGRSRADEHRAVLAEIAGIAAARQVDLVLIAGDLFDAAAPAPESEKIVYRALLDLARSGAAIAIVAGNHDSPQRLEAIRPLLELAHVQVAAAPARPADGGVRRIETRDGAVAAIACLPFLSQRGVVRADDLMRGDAADHGARYAERAAGVVDALCAALPGDCVRILLGHAMVHGGLLGGGERSAHTIFDYSVPATAFPASLHYAALGHLHRAQRLAGPCPIWYCGSPLQLDFGEVELERSVNLIEAAPARPAVVERVPLTAGRPLRTLRGTAEALLAQAGGAGDAWLRLLVESGPEPGPLDRLRQALPGAVEVRVLRPETKAAPRPAVAGRAPQELFADYLAQAGARDAALEALFAELLEEIHAAAAA